MSIFSLSRFRPAIVLLLCLLVVFAALPVAAGEGDGLIKVGDPQKDGVVKLEIHCKRANGSVEKVQVSVAILAADDAAEKADKIEQAIDDADPDCFSAGSFSNEVNLEPEDGNKITDVDLQQDTTVETISVKVDSAESVSGRFSLEGLPEGGSISLVLPTAVAMVPTSPSMPVPLIMQQLFAQLLSQNVAATYDGQQIVILEPDLSGQLLTADNTDFGLDVHLAVSTSDYAYPVIELDLLGEKRVVVLDAGRARLFDAFGQQQGSDIATTGPATVLGSGDTIIIVDNNCVRLYGPDGVQRGPTILTDGRATVIVDGDRIIIIDDDSVEIYDRNGNLVRHVPTDGRATVLVDGDRIIIID
ncbi:MAG: hypothetical protein L0332_23475, partial [Chloroflexi bacterium]|nr:hypothetical protein [Chloroflexota bacterium]MCI0729653.1 hypothetical protein [Chloroflexota bacterium]